ncbi:Abi family protein [Caldisalinibacter kiritimatiensis]|uniref:Abortive infection bacteriophage resistance protein n=1 Tax=Caldisalinibacter kiritimatiensis TaxID=1304284 RepID=R1CUY8_9FIRM|nr:Abi family protein [Caldisalinibacter kiritimatiensis]EOD00459.1 hypothetical protein L21TH_1494 [Caldisalinibacter kiritimatiensis]
MPYTGTPKRILENINYYNLINGYKELFILTPGTATSEEKYKRGAKFSEIYALYKKFDRELRMIFLKRILIVENQIKSQIAYEFSKKYGHDNYLKTSNFDLTRGDTKQLKKIVNLIKTVQSDIARQVDKHGAINHYMSEYGYIPLWVLVNILSLGTISYFYSCMKQTDRQNISRIYRISDADLRSILGILTLCRNKCAHDERLYDFRSHIYIRTNSIHRSLSIPMMYGRPKCGNKDLFAVLITLKILLKNKEFKEMVSEIKKALNKLSKELFVISIDDVLYKMGFARNWEDIELI